MRCLPLLLLLVSNTALAQDLDRTISEAPLMGTVFRVTLRAPDSPTARDATAACFAHFEHVDAVMSEWRVDSAVSELNRQAGIGPVAVPDDLYGVLEVALQISRESGGAFDVTWAALRGLWDFRPPYVVPDPAEVATRLPLVAWEDLVLDPGRRTAQLSRPGMAVGLGGIAKGWALAVCARELEGRGFEDFLLDAGGQLYGGVSEGAPPWVIGIQNPRGEPGVYFASVPLADASLATSGDYEHAFERDGVVYHHIIDPQTGLPARGVWSSTVLHADPTYADALSTATFVLGPTAGLALAERLGFGLVIVDDRGRIVGTPALLAQLGLTEPR